VPVQRNREIIRQWNILKQVASQRDCTITKLARDHVASPSTRAPHDRPPRQPQLRNPSVTVPSRSICRSSA
jgi:hypothetical protein